MVDWLELNYQIRSSLFHFCFQPIGLSFSNHQIQWIIGQFCLITIADTDSWTGRQYNIRRYHWWVNLLLQSQRFLSNVRNQGMTMIDDWLIKSMITHIEYINWWYTNLCLPLHLCTEWRRPGLDLYHALHNRMLEAYPTLHKQGPGTTRTPCSSYISFWYSWWGWISLEFGLCKAGHSQWSRWATPTLFIRSYM